MQCLFDWLSFTYHVDDVPDTVINKFFNYSLDWQTLHGLYGYKLQKQCNNIRIMYDGSEGMGTHIQITGEGLRFLESLDDFDIKNFLLNILTDNCSFTRVDLAVDCFNNELDLNTIGQKIKSREVVSRWRKSSIIESISLSDTEKVGHTINFGNRESAIYMRIYDKKLEQNSDVPYWIRLELELKEERADNCINVFLSKDKELSIFIHEILNHYIRFVDNNGDTNRSRFPTSKWWLDFLLTVESVKLTTGTLNDELDKKYAWLEKSVAPTLCMLTKIADGDLTYLYKLIDDNKHRLNSKHIALIKTHRAEQSYDEAEKKRALLYQFYTQIKKLAMINSFNPSIIKPEKSENKQFSYYKEREENKVIQQSFENVFNSSDNFDLKSKKHNDLYYVNDDSPWQEKAN